MRSPLRPLPAVVARWMATARLLRWLDALVAWLVVWGGAVTVLPRASSESLAALSALVVALTASPITPLTGRQRTRSGITSAPSVTTSARDAAAGALPARERRDR